MRVDVVGRRTIGATLRNAWNASKGPWISPPTLKYTDVEVVML